MASESERHDTIERPDHADTDRHDPMDGGIPLDLFWARLDPIDA